MNDLTIQTVQNTNTAYIRQGANWTKKIKLIDDDITFTQLTFSIIDLFGVTIYTTDVTTINDDGSVTISVSSNNTSAIPTGWYKIRFFVIVSGEKYYLSNLPEYVYVEA